MKKRGQITIFVIIALIIVSLAGLFFYLSGGLEQSVFPPETDNVKLFVQSCIEETLEEGIVFVSSRGGYFNLPDNYFDGFLATSYWMYDGRDISPSMEIVELELSKYIENQVGYCIESNEFTDKDFDFQDKKVETVIKADKILVNLKMPTFVTLGDSVSLIKNYKYEENNDVLFRFFSVSKNIIKNIGDSDNSLNIMPIFNITDSQKTDVFIDTYNEDTYIFNLKDRLNERYSFSFVAEVK